MARSDLQVLAAYSWSPAGLTFKSTRPRTGRDHLRGFCGIQTSHHTAVTLPPFAAANPEIAERFRTVPFAAPVRARRVVPVPGRIRFRRTPAMSATRLH